MSVNQALIIEPAIYPAQIVPQKIDTDNLVNIKLMPSHSRLGVKLHGGISSSVRILDSELTDRKRKLAAMKTHQAKQEQEIWDRMDNLHLERSAQPRPPLSQRRETSVEKAALELSN